MKRGVRRAETKFNRDLNAEQRKAEQQAQRGARKWERDTNRKLQAARPRVTYTTLERRYLAPVSE